LIGGKLIHVGPTMSGYIAVAHRICHYWFN
jgi:hypothetical protein